ncbi:MAG: hypothetical protein JWM46_929 [Candidatus Kaiserbacteria bacterium]|nr:hypothetical protein [Candidatus Kaiserbacteria bacterium]
MLIVLGGLLGSGRIYLANKLALTYGVYPYDLNSKKVPLPMFDTDGNVRTRVPKNKQERLRVYDKVLEDLPFASKMHPNILIHDTFHRQMPREYFLEKAKEICSPVVFIWIEAGEEYVITNMNYLHKRGVIKDVDAALRYRELRKKKLQPCPPSVPRFHTTTMSATHVEDLWQLIQDQVNSG